MKADCHIHMVLDGIDWRSAMGRHQEAPDEAYIRRVLSVYQSLGYTYLRDGGDKLGASKAAKRLAPEYGITYRTPLSPLSMAGHYGGFIGLQYENLKDYTTLVLSQKAQGADFVKIMISGLMDFDHYGVLTEKGLSPALISQLIHIAHEEGLAVMAHCNGARTMEAAAAAGVDSIEHGAYADGDTLCAMKENHVIWCPTLSTISNLLSDTRHNPGESPVTIRAECSYRRHFPDPLGNDTSSKPRHNPGVIQAILDSAMENVKLFAQMGGMVVPGTDAGAHNVPHGSQTEIPLLRQCGISDQSLITATEKLISIF